LAVLGFDRDHGCGLLFGGGLGSNLDRLEVCYRDSSHIFLRVLLGRGLDAIMTEGVVRVAQSELVGWFEVFGHYQLYRVLFHAFSGGLRLPPSTQTLR
jgi:hypothetical protein